MSLLAFIRDMTFGHYFLQVVRQEILYPQSSGLLTAILTSSGSLAIIFTCGLVTFHYRVMPGHINTSESASR